MSHRSCLVGSVLLAFLALPLHSKSLAVWKGPSLHTTRFAAVDKDVRLEVLNWGGSGRAIVLLAGAAIRLTFSTILGRSSRFTTMSTALPGVVSVPPVMAVIDALNLKRPILVGAGRSCGGLAGPWLYLALALQNRQET
jgi:hypothetical protein